MVDDVEKGRIIKLLCQIQEGKGLAKSGCNTNVMQPLFHGADGLGVGIGPFLLRSGEDTSAFFLLVPILTARSVVIIRPVQQGQGIVSLSHSPAGEQFQGIAKTAKLTYSTNNARFEEITAKASFKQSWLKGKRCIIPAASFDEPCWETGRNIWWCFRRADGAPWGLAGLWNDRVDPSTGEVVPSYTMLTINADHHPLMSRMHKPDPKLPPDQQDKRSSFKKRHTASELSN